MKRKVVSLLLVGAMAAGMLAGCGNVEPQQVPADGQEQGQQTGEAGDGAEEEELVELEVAVMALKSYDSSVTDPILEEINAVVEPELNIHVNIKWYDASTYMTQVPIAIQANEKLDLIMYTPMPATGYETLKTQGELMDISEYLEAEGENIMACVGEMLEGTSDAAGGIYGIPNNRNINSALHIMMRTDILDSLGLTEKAQNMSTWTEYREICEAVAEQTELSPIANSDSNGSVLVLAPYFTGADNFEENWGYDSIGDSTGLIYVDPQTDKVGCIAFTEDYEQGCARAQEWYKAGLINKDAATNQDYNHTLLKNNVTFSIMASGEFGAEEGCELAVGHDMTDVKITDAMIGTGATTKFGFCVPVCAQEPQAAIRFLNYLYGSTQLENTMTYGLEGRDWEYKSEDVIGYPEGVDTDNVAYHESDFLYGNQFAVSAWESYAEGFVEAREADQKNCQFSKYMGFSPDTSEITNELTACTTAADQYRPNLSSGSADDYKAVLAQMRDALTAAGIDKVIAAYQEQLDEWLSAR